MTYNDIDNLLGDIISTASFPKEIFTTEKVKTLSNINIINYAKRYVIEKPIPGKTKDNVEITFENNNQLKIQIKKQISSLENEVSYIKHNFNRDYEETQILTICEDIDKSKVNAKVENGMLYITLPKKQEEKAFNKKIQIL